ncbi:MAG: hypothetical protein QGH76_07905 [Phycisphaerales bacterium]|jgi:DNA-binding response OmpR family regulator|nr:hypothetical protein [Phycisphaerales bacterium]
MAPDTAQVEPLEQDGRLNLLLTCSSWRKDTAIRQLPRLLDPMGIRSFMADSGLEATDLIRGNPVHIALVDLSLPLRSGGRRGEPGGERILQLLRRLESPPPTIVLRASQATRREHARGLARSLHEGAFTVVDRPLRLETLLDALRRVVRRRYADRWPRAVRALSQTRQTTRSAKEHRGTEETQE